MILLDTTPLVALCDPRDSLHAAARSHLAHLSRERFVVCDPVLTEACFHLPHGAQRRRLRQFLEDVNASVLTVAGDVSFWWTVFDWLDTYADHDPDWTDGYIAALCGRDRTLSVWTYDTEFGTIWRRPDGSAIPLAVRGLGRSRRRPARRRVSGRRRPGGRGRPGAPPRPRRGCRPGRR